MANTFIKPEQVAAQALGVLARETTLAQFVWRDPAGDFRGSKNDTKTIRVPSYTTARTRALRSETGIVLDELAETKVDVTLDTHVYKAIRISDEELTLDITNFGTQVTAPAMSSVAREIDDQIAATMNGATTAVSVTLTAADPYTGMVDARIALNNANVPPGMRFCVVGSDVESAILKSDRLSKFDMSGSSDALREAVIGRMAGFTVLSNNAIDPTAAMFAHQTAFVLGTVTPVVPDGASWGAQQSYNGFGLRVLRDYLPDGSTGPADRLLVDAFTGTGVTADAGVVDINGKFQPSVTGTDPAIVVRAVKGTLA